MRARKRRRYLPGRDPAPTSAVGRRRAHRAPHGRCRTPRRRDRPDAAAHRREPAEAAGTRLARFHAAAANWERAELRVQTKTTRVTGRAMFGAAAATTPL